MSEDTRPIWDFDLTEAQVRKFDCTVIKITSHRAPVGVDSSREWIELHTTAKKFIPPKGWASLFEFSPTRIGRLISPNALGQSALKRLKEIDTWESDNKEERDEFERLKAKFDSKPKETS